MKLDPVFLVAPRPKPPSMSTRRAFLGMGAAFVAGGAIGSACGYAAGVANAKAVDASATEELQPSGNPELDEVRRLAVRAPIEELMRVAQNFVAWASYDYPDDVIVWRGVGRIAEHTLKNPDVARRRQTALFVAQAIETAHDSVRKPYEALVSDLRGIR